jgi:hypothetical protein
LIGFLQSYSYFDFDQIGFDCRAIEDTDYAERNILRVLEEAKVKPAVTIIGNTPGDQGTLSVDAIFGTNGSVVVSTSSAQGRDDSSGESKKRKKKASKKKKAKKVKKAKKDSKKNKKSQKKSPKKIKVKFEEDTTTGRDSGDSHFIKVTKAEFARMQREGEIATASSGRDGVAVATGSGRAALHDDESDEYSYESDSSSDSDSDDSDDDSE